MHLEIENLINMALADGEVTDKERSIILRKAEALGEDKDEIEMILEGRIALMYKEKNSADIQIQKVQNNKEGVIKKCPSCGSSVSSFQTNCIDCGLEFRNIEVVSSINKLHAELQNAEEIERNRPRSWVEKLDGEMAVAKAVANRQKAIISSFPVPNAKEDLLEFLSISCAEASKKLSIFIASVHPEAVLKSAWKAKCEQVILKARLVMKEDKTALEEIGIYAKQIGIK
jgi:hypothetical protein